MEDVVVASNHIKKILNEDDHKNLIIIGMDGQLTTHSLAMGMASEYMKTLLTDSPPESIIILPEIKCRTIFLLLSLLSKGEVFFNVTADMEDLSALTQLLGIKFLNCCVVSSVDVTVEMSVNNEFQFSREQKQTISESLIQNESVSDTEVEKNNCDDFSDDDDNVPESNKTCEENFVHDVQYTCEECGNQFLEKCHLIVHQQLHANKVLQCLICKKVYQRKENLLDHVRLIHTQENLFKCESCGKKFGLRKNLVRHQKAFHHFNKIEILNSKYEKTGSNEDKEIKSLTGQMNKNFTCNLCKRVFSEESLKLVHQQSHTNTPFQCPICSKSYLRKENILEHIRLVHTKENLFACSNCGKKFGLKKNLVRHFKYHHITRDDTLNGEGNDNALIAEEVETKKSTTSSEKLNCRLCEKTFRDRSLLIVHEQQHTDSIVKCVDCGKCYSRGDNLIEHIRIAHTKENLQRCDICNKVFGLKKTLIRHYKTHIGRVNDKLRKSDDYRCKVCERKCKSSSQYETHMRSHSGEKPYKCSGCDKTFSRSSSLKQHMNMSHEEDDNSMKKPQQTKGFQCEVCGKVFGKSSDVKRHMLVHTQEKPYECKTCGMRYRGSTALKVHQRSHSGERPYKCEKCSKSYTNKFELIIHQRSHTGEKPFQCLICNKLFAAKQRMKVHMNLHSGLKPFLCDSCPMAFPTRTQLKLHSRTHTGDRPKQCELCGRRFRVQCQLRSHLMSHTGERPFACDICGKAFSSSTRKKRHMKIHTKDIS